MEGINSFGLQEAIQFLIETGKASKLGTVETVHGKETLVTQGRDGEVKLVSLDEFRKEPERITASPTFNNVVSFAEYVNKFKADRLMLASNALTFNPKAGSGLPIVRAALDYHLPDGPSRYTHTATLQFALTNEAQNWFGGEEKRMVQHDFVDFIEDNMHRISDPPGADLMELIQELTITEKSTFKSRKRKPDGSFSVEYTDEAEGKTGAGGFVDVPGTFRIKIPLFEGDDFAAELHCRMRFKVRPGGLGLEMWYKMMDASDIIRTRLMALCGEVEEATASTVLFGQL
jgi:uncharacterized protein YfdQ (DUF2303 family)